jgi:hypothetical protein
MEQAQLRDRVRWGMNIAARTIGAMTDLYRPRSVANPLDPTHRILRVHAAFMPRRGSVLLNNGYGDALWRGIFDAAYTQTGDYLVQAGRTLFIASQHGLAEPLCVQTNRVITISRATPPGVLGAVSYGGLIAENAVVLIENWPASVLGIGNSGRPTAGLPTDVPSAVWTVLMPAWDGIKLQTGDLYTDDLGRSAVIVSSELTDMGWRLTVKQATT